MQLSMKEYDMQVTGKVGYKEISAKTFTDIEELGETYEYKNSQVKK